MVESGQEALGAVRQTRFSAVLTDMRMPNMGGAAVATGSVVLTPIPVR